MSATDEPADRGIDMMFGAAASLPPVVREWVRQLLDPAFVELVRARSTGQIDVRLSSARGKARARPTVVLDGGPQPYGV